MVGKNILGEEFLMIKKKILLCLCFLFKFTRTAALQGNRQKMPVFCGDKVAKRPIGFLLFIADFSSSCSQ
jgi:hypothetical protein